MPSISSVTRFCLTSSASRSLRKSSKVAGVAFWTQRSVATRARLGSIAR